MIILSHRGYWLEPLEKNDQLAFQRSFELGFGTETDIRDSNGRLVISHDMPTGDEMSFTNFLSTAESYSRNFTLALNIKSDGLVYHVADHLSAHPNLDCFVFDMAVPDMRGYLEVGVPVFTRMSEVEQQPAWLERSAGVWLDSFNHEWYDLDTIKNIISLGKRVCVVSPELHKRKHTDLWRTLKLIADSDQLMLCTDFPVQAKEFFA
jgi:glycerophosphoryl diester phosphodiesterase